MRMVESQSSEYEDMLVALRNMKMGEKSVLPVVNAKVIVCCLGIGIQQKIKRWLDDVGEATCSWVTRWGVGP